MYAVINSRRFRSDAFHVFFIYSTKHLTPPLLEGRNPSGGISQRTVPRPLDMATFSGAILQFLSRTQLLVIVSQSDLFS